MFIAVPDIIRGNVLDVSPKNWRIQAILIRTMDMSLLLINSYFPQDMKTVDYGDNELEEILAEIRDVHYRTINLMTLYGQDTFTQTLPEIVDMYRDYKTTLMNTIC